MNRQFSQGVVDYSIIKSVDRPLILRRRGCCHPQPTSFNVPPRRVCPRCALRAHRRVLGTRRATLKLRDFKCLGARYGCPPAERDHGPASKSAAAALAASARRTFGGGIGEPPKGTLNNSLVARSARLYLGSLRRVLRPTHRSDRQVVRRRTATGLPARRRWPHSPRAGGENNQATARKLSFRCGDSGAVVQHN